MGRFGSPDAPFADQEETDPQSWNLYAYVRGNPLTHTDPSGGACVSNSGGRTYHDDDSGGETCSEVDEKNRKEREKAERENEAQERQRQAILTKLQADSIQPEGERVLGAWALGAAAGRVLGAVWGTIFGRTIEGAGAGVEEILATAGSSVRNQTIRASSRAAAEEAAEKWVGAGARPILREGKQVGFVSTDGTKVARWTSAGKLDPYMNLTNNATGGNLHVHF